MQFDFCLNHELPIDFVLFEHQNVPNLTNNNIYIREKIVIKYLLCQYYSILLQYNAMVLTNINRHLILVLFVYQDFCQKLC